MSDIIKKFHQHVINIYLIFKSYNVPNLICKIRNARMQAGVDDAMFLKWQEEIKQGFYSRNSFSIPNFLQKMGSRPVAEMPMTLTFREHLLSSDMRSQALLAQVNELRMKCNSMENKLDDVLKILKDKAIARDSDTGNPNSIVPMPEKIDVLEYAIHHRHMKTVLKGNLRKLVYYYIVEGVESSYRLEEDKARFKSSHSRTKKCVSTVLSCVGDHKKEHVHVLLHKNDRNAFGVWKKEFVEAIDESINTLTMELRKHGKLEGTKVLCATDILKNGKCLTNKCECVDKH